MSASGWVLQIGIRVIDVGLLVAFLIWMLRRRHDDDEGPGDEGPGGGGGGPDPGPAPGGDGGRLRRLARADSARHRVRDHSRRPSRPRRRGHAPVTSPLPARVRRPRTPAPARRAVR